MQKIKAIILSNELDNDHHLWIKACEDFKEKIDYRVVNLTLDSWLEDIQLEAADVLLAKPGGLTAAFKQLYDERIWILEKELNYFIFPKAEEIFIYENKRFFSFWLMANRIPHPETHIFYHHKEAENYLEKTNFPVIAKVNIGASGRGVSIIKSYDEAMQYLADAFSDKGAWQRSGPNLEKGGLMQRGLYYIWHPGRIRKKMEVYKVLNHNVQKGFVLFQKFIPHDYEWRVVRIGDSFFAHKKLKIGEKASGTLLKNYDNPPESIFNFVREITDRHRFFSQSVDVFETKEGNYLVNEMQCIFGQSDAYQMLVNGVPGRYRYENEAWVFEAGDFNKNESYNLRMEWIIQNLLHE